MEIIGHLHLLIDLTHMESKPLVPSGQGVVFRSGTGEGSVFPQRIEDKDLSFLIITFQKNHSQVIEKDILWVCHKTDKRFLRRFIYISKMAEKEFVMIAFLI